MATDLGQVKSAPAAKYDAYVEAQLGRARGRIRTLDATGALLALAAASLAFGLTMAFLDRWLAFSSLLRQAAFGFYLMAAAVFLILRLVLPLSRQINPYYAARQVEQAIPGAKNSVVNWLDLHERTLPAAIRGALSQRAAKDLAQADLETAISGRRTLWLGGATSALFVVAVVTLIALGPQQFLSLLGRAFAPFIEGTIASRTQLTLLQPEGGDVTVPVGRSVNFSVEVGGRVPEVGQADSVKVLFRHQPADPWEEQPLERESGREWTTSLPAFQVQNGFWYKITGGDAETPEHRVTVRSTPLIGGFDVTYHYRPYLHWSDTLSRDPNLKEMRGTEVTLLAYTNRNVKDGRLDMEMKSGRKSVSAELVATDPRALRFRFTLEQDGKYRIWFTSTEGESNSDPAPYTIQVLLDHAPQVVLKEPGKDIELPANGVLKLAGSASDDIGVKSLTLRMIVKDGPALQPKPYREGKSFQLVDGGYPQVLDYEDFIELAKLKDDNGRSFALQPKLVLEYWLEALDNCDHPEPNRGESTHYLVTITEPAKDNSQQQKQRDQAEKEKKKHEQEQDKKLDQENKQRQEEAKEREKKDQQNAADQHKKEGGEQKPNEAQPKNKPEQGAKDEQQRKDLDKQAEKLKNEINKEDKKQNDKGQGKDDKRPQPKGGQKDEGQQKQQPKPGECKECGEGEPSGNAGASKEGGTTGKRDEAGQSKDGGKPEPNQSKAAGKEKNDTGQKPGDDKGLGQSEPQSHKSENKDSGKGEDKAGAGEKKDGPSQPGEKKELAEAKEAGQQGTGEKKEPEGVAKGESPAAPKGENKDAAASTQAKAAPKEDKKDGSGGASAKAEEKPAKPEEASGAGVAKDEKKEGDPKKGSGSAVDKLTPEAKKEISELEKALQDDDPKKREEAARKLDELSKNAKDANERQAAREAMDQARKESKEDGPKVATTKSPPKEPNPQNPDAAPPCAECKGGKPGGQNPSAGAGKGGNGPGDNTAKGQSKGQGGNSGNGGKPGEQAVDAGAAKTGPGQAGKPGSGSSATGGRNEHPRDAQNAESPSVDDDPSNYKRAGVLQLEDFKKVNKDVLDRAGMTPEEFERFKKAYLAEMQKRQDAEARGEDKLPAPQRGGGLSNLGVRRVTPGTPGQIGSAQTSGPAEPPPELREGWKEFTRRMAEMGRAPEKK